MRIKLQDVTVHNWQEVVSLELHEEQEDFVASNLYSVAESKFDPDAIPKAIYSGKRLVGFLMYESLKSEGDPHSYNLYRFMIDRRYQGKGYGKAALQALLDLIRRQDRAQRSIQVCYYPENSASQRLFASFGFREVGLDEDNEMIAKLDLSRPLRK